MVGRGGHMTPIVVKRAEKDSVVAAIVGHEFISLVYSFELSIDSKSRFGFPLLLSCN